MMQVKRYVAPTFAEALILAKNELGTDAVIVESRKIQVGGFFGLFGRAMTELTVAVDVRPGQRPGPAPQRAPQASPPAAAQYPQPQVQQAQPPAAPAPGQQAQPPVAPAQQAQLPAVPEPAAAPAHMAQPTAAESATQAGAVAPAGSLTNVERELSNLRSTIALLLEQNPSAVATLRGFGREVYDSLTARGVDQATALEIGQRCQADDAEGRSILARELTRIIGSGAPIAAVKGERKVIALVGPTGVGKTTTLAKLAALFALDRQMDVALVTADTFRIAAVAQLRTYADILGVPLYTVDTPAQVAHALAETASKDLVLVDTGGRNFRDAARMAELKEMLAVLRPDETHLVMAVNANQRDAFEALDAFLPLGVNRLSFTKLDEASAPGLILNLKLRCDHPLGYLTDGQSVPEDIIPADQADFTRILMGA